MNSHRDPVPLDEVDRRLLNDFQARFPLSTRPFSELADLLGVNESEVIARLKRLLDAGVVSRVGPVLHPRRVGASTLAAMAVPPEHLAEVADLVSGYAEVNHNYEREHRFNLWFVLTAGDEHRLAEVMEEIASRTGIEVLDLPMLEEYHIDLGFALQWT